MGVAQVTGRNRDRPMPPIQILDSLIISNSVDGVSFGADFCRINPIRMLARTPKSQQRPCQRRPCPMSTATSSAPMGSPASMSPNRSARPIWRRATGGAWLTDQHPREVVMRWPASAIVNFTPWISGAVGSLADPLVINTPSPVAFQFTEASNTFFLGQGVGNLNDPPPFTLSTNNSILQVGSATGPSLGAFIGGDKKLAATLIPDAEGPATLSVVGPCRLHSSSAARPSWHPESRSPRRSGTVAGACAADQQRHDTGWLRTPVFYCITIQNTGGIALDKHTIDDPMFNASPSEAARRQSTTC